VSFAVLASACGRTPEARTAYPCLADLTADCAGLEEQREDLENTYLQEAAKDAPDAVRADDIAACSHTVVQEQLSAGCLKDPCEALCEMHPCDVQGGDDCGALCSAVVEAEQIAASALQDAILRTADRPGFCTCQVCDEASAALCTDVFVCP
jgi:hypothetical protein